MKKLFLLVLLLSATVFCQAQPDDSRKIAYDWLEHSAQVQVSAETQAVLDRMTGPIPNNYKSALNTFINTLVASGDYNQIQEIVFYGMNTEANSLVGWKGVRNATKRGSPTWSATTGFTCSNNNGIDSNFIGTTDGGSLFTQNSAAFSVHCLRNDDQSVGTYLFGGNSATTHFKFLQQGLFGEKRYAINSASVNLSDNSDNSYFADNSIYTIQRTAASGSGSTKTFKNGVQGVSINSTSNGLSSVQVGIGELNSNGSYSSYFVGQLTMHMAHSPSLNLTTFKNAYQTMLTSLGITTQLVSYPSSSTLATYSQSPTFGDPILIFQAGQSNIKDAVAYSNIYSQLVENVPNVKVWDDNSAFFDKYKFRAQGWTIQDVVPYLVGKWCSNPVYYVNLSANSTQLGRTGSAPYTGTTSGTGTGSLYNISGAVSRFQAAKAAFDAAFPSATKRYVLITAISETDANNSTNATALENNLQQFWSQMRTDLSLPNLIVIFPRLSNSQSGCAFLSTGQTSQDNADAADSKAYSINTNSLALQDNLHFSNVGAVDLGVLIADQIFTLRSSL